MRIAGFFIVKLVTEGYSHYNRVVIREGGTADE